MVMTAFIEVEGQAVVQVLVGQVEPKRVVQPEVDSEGGFGVSSQEVPIGGSVHLLDGKALEEPDVFLVVEPVVSELHVDCGLVVKLEVPGSFEDCESGIVVLLDKIEGHYLLRLADPQLAQGVGFCQCRVQLVEVVFDEGLVVDVVIFLEKDVSHLDQGLHKGQLHRITVRRGVVVGYD